MSRGETWLLLFPSLSSRFEMFLLLRKILFFFVAGIGFRLKKIGEFDDRRLSMLFDTDSVVRASSLPRRGVRTVFDQQKSRELPPHSGDSRAHTKNRTGEKRG
ncbi:hypothetical protein LY78DRAFT_44460 [Colletotrichum sublineola]|nr:hypothetical protein LY78DRAFT_44460 [Colletotrichum sublineola]